MYKKLCSTKQQNVGIALWYKYGIYNDPAIIFATGRHGKVDEIPKPYILYNLRSKLSYLYDYKYNIITGYFSAISIDKNLILFAGNSAKNIEHSRLYLISPNTNRCKLIHTFIPDNNKFAARCGIVNNKTVIIGGLCGQILIYDFDSKNKLKNNKVINISSIDNVIVGLYYSNFILSVGIRLSKLNLFNTNNEKQIWYPESGKFTKSASIDLKNENTIYFTTNMQCTGIYHTDKYIICIGSGHRRNYSQCFYIPIINNKFGKKVNLGICDGRQCIVFNNNLFILCVTDSHIYIENFTSENRKIYYIKNINPECRGCVLYKPNKIIISSLNGDSYILNLDKVF